MLRSEVSSKAMKDTLKDEELVEVDFEGELISALEELEKSRKKNKALKK